MKLPFRWSGKEHLIGTLPEAISIESWSCCQQEFNKLSQFECVTHKVVPGLEDLEGGPYLEKIRHKTPRWIFRGQARLSYDLQPGIERLSETLGEPGDSYVHYEEVVIEEFRKRAHLYAHGMRLPASEDLIDWLPVMQHYGLPTRLLDFTFSPWVALYFALAGDDHLQEDPPCVWAIDLHALLEVARPILKRVVRSSPGAEARPLPESADLNREALRISADRIGEECVCALSAGTVNPRLDRQQGLFVFALGKCKLAGALATLMSGRTGWCHRFSFQSSALAGAEMYLHGMNIHHLSLFPDLEGLARYCTRISHLRLVPDC